MQIVPTSEAPPFPYPPRGPFRRPLSHQTFSEVVHRVRLFSQESLVTLGQRILWKVYHQPDLLDERHADWPARNVGALFADRLVALACLHANNHRPAATEREFVLLCWELHNCADDELSNYASADVSDRIGAVENASLRTALERLPPRTLLVEAFKARTAGFNLAGRWDGLPDLIRPMLIAEEFTRRLELRCGALAETKLQNFLRGSVVEFFRNGLVLNGLLNQGSVLVPLGGGKPIRELGVVHLGDGPVGTAEIAEAGVTGEGLRAFALRLSRTLDDFGSLRDELASVPEAERKYSRQVNWLGRWPMLDMGVQGTARRLVAPSPRGFAMSMERFLLYEMPKVLIADGMQDTKGRELNAVDITSIRGAAYAAYLEQVLSDRGLLNADGIADVEGKRPDFIWAGETCGLLIEAKFSLLPNEDRALTNFSAAVTTWERAYEALEQPAEFLLRNHELLRKLWPNVQTWLPVLVVHDALPEETTRFKALAKRAGLMGGAGVALLSTSELEKWVRNSTADALAREAKRVWDQVEPSRVCDDLLLDIPERASGVPDHIRAALRRILPLPALDKALEEVRSSTEG